MIKWKKNVIKRAHRQMKTTFQAISKAVSVSKRYFSRGLVFMELYISVTYFYDIVFASCASVAFDIFSENRRSDLFVSPVKVWRSNKVRYNVIDLLQLAFYFYLFGTIFLLLDSYVGATKLPLTRSTYNVCHYHQVYLPEEAMALQARDRGMSYLLEDIVAKHRRKNVIHFIVNK